jgi:hypothetical protein
MTAFQAGYLRVAEDFLTRLSGNTSSPSWNRRWPCHQTLEGAAGVVSQNDHPVCAFKGCFAAFS